MAGLSGELRCEGFIESDTFTKSKDQLKRGTGLTDRQIDVDRVEALPCGRSCANPWRSLDGSEAGTCGRLEPPSGFPSWVV